MPLINDPALWWVAVDGWQIESGEVPDLAVGSTSEFPLEFSWLRPPIEAEGPIRRQQVRRNTYRVTGELRSRSDGVNVIAVGSQVRQSVGEADWYNQEGLQPQGMVAGTLTIGVDVTWWPGQPSEFLRRWKIIEMIEFVPKTAGAQRGSWQAASRTERSFASSKYKVLCELLG